MCPVVIADAERWNGTAEAGDSVQFRSEGKREPPVLRARGDVVCRADGDGILLVEFGPNVLDLNLRVRAHALEQEVRKLTLPGIIDITPGVRSLQIHYGAGLRREALLELLDECESRIGDLSEFEVPFAHGASAAKLGRSGNAACNPEIYAGRTSGCAMVPEQP